MSQPTGLYGWVRSNDGRSTFLFVGFLLAIQPIAALALFVPLLIIDPQHAPILAWGEYFMRYAPLVLIVSVIWFCLQMLWHIETVKRAVGFEFVDNTDEPYLCRVIEPLIVMMGLPAPFVGVIETPARNAFACGIGRKKAVVVVTRGLINDLEPDELAAVLAHELSHIRNGDIRLLAAANICMSAITFVNNRNPLKLTVFHGVLALAAPMLLPLTLAGTFIGHMAMRAGQVSRLLISSSREFIADAEAVQFTKNPAALATALVKVERNHSVEGARTEEDAMMIAGDTEGVTATHPPVAQRIAALARATGSMVFNAPMTSGFGKARQSPTFAQAEAAALLRALPPTKALQRVRTGAKENFLGLTPVGALTVVATLIALLFIHQKELHDPWAMAAKFDPRPLGLYLSTPPSCRARMEPSEHCQVTARDFEEQENTLVGWLVERDQQRSERNR